MVESKLTGKDYLNFKSIISIVQNLGDETIVFSYNVLKQTRFNQW